MLNKLNPFLNIGTGAFIKEELEVKNWRQEDLAEILGLSLKTVNRLLQNKQAITLETARLLNKAFGQSPQYWINLDTNYRLRLQGETDKEKNVENKANIYQYMPISEMVKKRWVKPFKTLDGLINETRSFWKINDLDFSFLDQNLSPNFRKSDAFTQYNRYYALTWFRMAQKCAPLYKVGRFRKAILKKLIRDFSTYTVAEKGVELFLQDLNKAGVKFFVLSHLQKTYIDGASFFDKTNPVIVYTLRYNRTDNFWFTIAHEIAHILLHLKKRKDYFIDNLEQLTTDIEKEADRFAVSLFKAKEILGYFRHFKYVSKDRVMDCAQSINIAPAIIVGVLQHYDKLSRRNLNKFKVSASNLIPDDYQVEERLKPGRVRSKSFFS